MKKTYTLALMGVIAAGLSSCQDLEDVNVSPNAPDNVTTNLLISGTEKYAVDYIYDNWFSGRQCLVYSQQWAQRNYTEEDRYQVRESVNNNYFNYLYRCYSNISKIIELNSDEANYDANSVYGDLDNQDNIARILRAWVMSVITDTWGSVPYSEIGKLESEGVMYCKYDAQADIYAGLIKELTEAAAALDESKDAFTSGDNIFGGDVTKWKKFAGSLKCRLAIHLSKSDPNWKTYIAEALESGVMESNDDGAYYTYSTSGSEYCKFYEGWYVDGRNDFTITRELCDILKGQPDTLNSKSHPFEGVVDPRLYVYTTGFGGKSGSDAVYQGMPYGVKSSQSSAVRNQLSTPNWYTYPPAHLAADYAIPIMTYAEQKFIECEYNGFSADDYKAGVVASLEAWTGDADVETTYADYLTAVTGTVNAETLALQKYIDLYLNGTEAWTEIRRTGYPEQLLRPGEIAAAYFVTDKTTKKVTEVRYYNFEPLSEVHDDIIAKVKYPTNESTLNGPNFSEALQKYTGGSNNYYTKMIFDVRTSTYDHPSNL